MADRDKTWKPAPTLPKPRSDVIDLTEDDGDVPAQSRSSATPTTGTSKRNAILLDSDDEERQIAEVDQTKNTTGRQSARHTSARGPSLISLRRTAGLRTAPAKPAEPRINPLRRAAEPSIQPPPTRPTPTKSASSVEPGPATETPSAEKPRSRTAAIEGGSAEPSSEGLSGSQATRLSSIAETGLSVEATVVGCTSVVDVPTSRASLTLNEGSNPTLKPPESKAKGTPLTDEGPENGKPSAAKPLFSSGPITGTGSTSNESSKTHPKLPAPTARDLDSRTHGATPNISESRAVPTPGESFSMRVKVVVDTLPLHPKQKARKSAPSGGGGASIKIARPSVSRPRAPPTASRNAPQASIIYSDPESQSHPLAPKAPSKAGAAGQERSSRDARDATIGQVDPPVPTVEPESGTDKGTVKEARENERTMNILQPINSQDFDHSRAAVEESLKQHLREAHGSHAYLVKACLRRNRECFEREALVKERSLLQGLAPRLASADRFFQQSPLQKMQPIQVPRTTGSKKPFLNEETIRNSRTKDGIKSNVTAEVTLFHSTAVILPPFREYVSLQDNVLSENQDELLNFPHIVNDRITQDAERNGLIRELKQAYKLRNTNEHLLDDLNRFYSPGTNAFLSEIGVKWEHILFLLLAPDAEIRRIDSQDRNSKQFSSKEILKQRSLHLVDESDREKLKWKTVLTLLPIPSTHQLQVAALACSAFWKQLTLNIWHLVQRCGFIQEEISQNLVGTIKGPAFEYRSATCRVCQMHNCQYHGELREYPDSDDVVVAESQNSLGSLLDAALQGDSQSKYGSSDAESTERGPSSKRPQAQSSAVGSHQQSTIDFDDTDSESDIEVVINYKRMVNAHILPAGSIPRDGCTATPPAGRFNVEWWTKHTNTAAWEFRKPFYPCYHPGTPCVTAQCRCYREGITCEKSCTCSLSCSRRFPGCSCAHSFADKQSVCGAKGSKCVCVMMNRECDADLCGTCGATDILDPVNRYEDNGSKCSNVPIQRAVPSKTLLGHSEVHGIGLYAGEDVGEDEFIGEYKGQIITLDEGRRRGIIYEKQQTMYLFKLNQEQEIDGTHMGNKTRFINNADSKHSNCYVKNLLCNTVHRIGLYASQNIEAGTELFFHYGYSEEETKGFKQPSKAVVKLPAGKVVQVLRKAKPTSTISSSLCSRKHYGAAEKTAADLTLSRTGPNLARKTATGPRQVLLRGPGRANGMDLSEQLFFIADEDDSKGSSSSSSSLSRNSETDNEEFWKPDTDEQEEQEEVIADKRRTESGDEGLVARKALTRQNMAPVLAVKSRTSKRKKGKLGEARSSASRKRKRLRGHGDD